MLINKLWFQKTKHSTELAVLELVEWTIFTLDKYETPINIFLDLSKAFDTLNHTMLLNKLHHYGIGDGSLIFSKVIYKTGNSTWL